MKKLTKAKYIQITTLLIMSMGFVKQASAACLTFYSFSGAATAICW